MLNADAIVVKLNSGDHKTIHLSSIRPPRLEGDSTQVTVGRWHWGGREAPVAASPVSVTVPGWIPLPVGSCSALSSLWKVAGDGNWAFPSQ